MLLGLLLAVAATTAPQLVVLDIDNRAGAAAADVEHLNIVLADRASAAANVDVLAAADLQALAEMSAAQQAADCDDNGCLSEIAGAMDARYLVKPRLTRAGERYALRIVIFDAVEGRIATRATATATGLEALAPVAEHEFDRALAAAGLLRTTAATAPPVALITTVVGAGAALVGLAMFGISEAKLSSPAEFTSSTYADEQGRGRLGAIIAGAGVIVAVGGGVFMVVSE